MKLKSGLHVDTSLDADHFEHPLSISEKVLLAAVLERATRDISIRSSHYERKRALDWFTAKNHESTISNFSYQDIIHHLGLGTKEVEKLNQKIREGKEFSSSTKKKYNG